MSVLSKAYYKNYGGELVTPSQYEAKNRIQGTKHPAICVGCEEHLISHGVKSPNVTERFRHHKNTGNNVIKCPLHSSSKRNSFLNKTELDPRNGNMLRKEFFKKENIITNLNEQKYVKTVQIMNGGMISYYNLVFLVIIRLLIKSISHRLILLNIGTKTKSVK